VHAREKLLSPMGTNWRFGAQWSDDPIWKGNAMPSDGDEGLVDGVEVGIIYQSAPAISHVIHDVISHGAITTEEIPFRPYTLIGLLRRAWVLRDKEAVLEKWLEQTATYPRLLKLNILRRFIPILRENAGAMREYAERRLGPSLQLSFLTQASDALDSILYALNELYDPADKRAQLEVLPTLAEVPRDFLARYNYVLEGPFDDAGALERAAAFGDLAAEVLEMAGSEMG
jgi:hypothetical protein